MRIIGCMIIMCGICLCAQAQEGKSAMVRVIEELQMIHGVDFVYDSSLGNLAPGGTPVAGESLITNLKRVFSDTRVRWEIEGNSVLLIPKQERHTLSGYVCQDNGEPLINVTVFDTNTQTGTLTNEHGFFSLRLPEGKHTIHFSYIGYKEVVKEVELTSDYQATIYLTASVTPLPDVEVVANLNSILQTTQTGKVSLSSDQLHTEYALFSSPDLMKKLQTIPGVSSGTELLSGMYVHGGRSDENLFLLDGMPLYQINHAGGLFSAFNTDIIKNVDFYKSGFPARYGGRLASVTDVRTKEGDLKTFHGSFSLGLLDGRIALEGPIVKGKTSFSFGMRRSWIDLFTVPYFGLESRLNGEDKRKVRYAFHDINGKVTHHFSTTDKLSFSLYSGTDLMKWKTDQTLDEDRFNSDFHSKWGNLTAALAWNHTFHPKLSVNFSAVYTHNIARYDYEEEECTLRKGAEGYVSRMARSNHSAIRDIGYRMEFDCLPTMQHRIRFGSNYLFHLYRPQSTTFSDYTERDGDTDLLLRHIDSRYRGHECSLYAEDEMQIAPKWRANAGLHYTLYHTDGNSSHSFDPRLAVSYRYTEYITLKASYTGMSQFAHLLSNTYLNLPTDCWVPSTRKVPPMRAKQMAAGVYMELPRGIKMSLEGYYRTTCHLLEYDGGNSLMLPADRWEEMVKTGRGRSYGAEFAFSHCTSKYAVEGGYTLSWSGEKFEAFYPDWYPGKFDSRHKIDLTFRYHFHERIVAYAAWTYHSGNRITLPTHYVEEPPLPGMTTSEQEWMYGMPNNARLPVYHRLDVGINFRRITRRGFERIWNISVYNAYCRMNAFYTQVERMPDGSFRGKATGVIPILPSFSYTLKF